MIVQYGLFYLYLTILALEDRQLIAQIRSDCLIIMGTQELDNGCMFIPVRLILSKALFFKQIMAVVNYCFY